MHSCKYPNVFQYDFTFNEHLMLVSHSIGFFLERFELPKEEFKGKETPIRAKADTIVFHEKLKREPAERIQKLKVLNI